MRRLKKDKMIWVKQIFVDLWRYEKIKEHDYKEYLKSIDELGDNPMLIMAKAKWYVVFYKTFIELITNKYVDKVIFMVIGYFVKDLLDFLSKYFN